MGFIQKWVKILRSSSSKNYELHEIDEWLFSLPIEQQRKTLELAHMYHLPITDKVCERLTHASLDLQQLYGRWLSQNGKIKVSQTPQHPYEYVVLASATLQREYLWITDLDISAMDNALWYERIVLLNAQLCQGKDVLGPYTEAWTQALNTQPHVELTNLFSTLPFPQKFGKDVAILWASIFSELDIPHHFIPALLFLCSKLQDFTVEAMQYFVKHTPNKLKHLLQPGTSALLLESLTQAPSPMAERALILRCLQGRDLNEEEQAQIVALPADAWEFAWLDIDNLSLNQVCGKNDCKELWQWMVCHQHPLAFRWMPDIAPQAALQILTTINIEEVFFVKRLLVSQPEFANYVLEQAPNKLQSLAVSGIKIESILPLLQRGHLGTNINDRLLKRFLGLE